MTKNEILHILRNPYGWTEDEVRRARLEAADLIEGLWRELREDVKDKYFTTYGDIES